MSLLLLDIICMIWSGVHACIWCRGPPPEYGFGTPLYGSCGYLSQEGTQGVDFSDVPFPEDMLSAVANVNDDFPGSCGR